ncbi:DUF2982 domain-containing protein [Alteromonas sp. 345S023]|jgi:hypothetical protein|uniref:DUF2982 domain-containing protein n=1 Tax=Alteromonas profundi TaxID=2696062 RepID=A0A7X5LMK5_9ALTE|nr:DUF2982 domain-containing protein [Alteromonas profundi]NDV92094.1 DUF2982 domain-containing protein [Alteromonas profundi]
MSGSSAEPIFIRAASKSNGITSIVIGAAGLAVSALWFVVLPSWLFLAGIFITSASLVALLIGYFKVREPEFSLEITKQHIVYRHRLGNWQIDWDNLQRAGCPRIRQGLTHVELETVGFKLTDYSNFLHSISPRLATHLLMEQRPLLLQNTDENCASGNCYEQTMFDDNHFKLSDGTVLTGVKAMLANRMVELRRRLGFDVYIATSDIDRTPGEFAAFIAQCQQARVTPQTAP